MRLSSLVILVLFSILSAGTATQNDWSGGDGIWGIVIDWSNKFYSENSINYAISGSLSLLSKCTVDSNFSGAKSVYAADVNGDGYTDVLGAASTADDITWWENNDGSGTSWTEHLVDGNFNTASSVFAIDVNGDGYTDVLGAARVDNDITWWENNDGSGTSWTEHIIDGNFSSAVTVYATDVNGDGYIDVLGSATGANSVAWWENIDGSGTLWTKHIIDSLSDPWSVYATDINNDGYTDVLSSAINSSEGIIWWENYDGTGLYWTKHTVETNYQASAVYATDVNGDGYIDVLGAEVVDDDITWWENVDGSGTSWAKHTVDGSFNAPYSIYATDMNDDGYTDVLGAAMIADDITWWENNDGSGTSWTEHTVDGNYDGATSVYASDVSGDGCMDILGASLADGDITWWDIMGGFKEGFLESSVLNTQESPSWQTIEWTCTEPTGTSVSFQVRASANPGEMGEWSDTLTSPSSLATILTDGNNLFQYRAILSATNSDSTPTLDDVTIEWATFVETEEEEMSEINTFLLLGARSNPSFGNVEIDFVLPVGSRIDMTIYDLYGRIVNLTTRECEEGQQSIMLEGINSGIYFAHIRVGNYDAVKSFVMIE